MFTARFGRFLMKQVVLSKTSESISLRIPISMSLFGGTSSSVVIMMPPFHYTLVQISSIFICVYNLQASLGNCTITCVNKRVITVIYCRCSTVGGACNQIIRFFASRSPSSFSSCLVPVHLVYLHFAMSACGTLRHMGSQCII